MQQELKDNKFIISDNMYLLKTSQKFYFYKKEVDYEVTIDFFEKNCLINLLNENKSVNIFLNYLKVIDNSHKIIIIYSLDEMDEQNKIVLEMEQ